MCLRIRHRLVATLAIAVVWACATTPSPASSRHDFPHILVQDQPAGSTAIRASEFVSSPVITGMLDQVQSTVLYSLTAELTGEWPAIIGGEPYTLSTRFTDSGVPIEKATLYAYEHLAGAGATASYHAWSTSGHSNRNVVAVITGTTDPDEIVMAVAHLDSLSPSYMTLAPGADDNASGSAAVLTMAGILSQHRFSRTIRFVLFTGEEQGLHGSKVYAAEAQARGDNIVAVFNMDMIGWNTANSWPGLDLFIRTPAIHPGDLAIAGTFTNVVQTYDLSDELAPEIVVDDAMSYSDHWYFWQRGYSGILAIEDDSPPSDFNPYYHSTSDRLPYLNMPYFTAFVKASLGTVAHLAQPVQPVPVVFLASVQRP